MACIDAEQNIFRKSLPADYQAITLKTKRVSWTNWQSTLIVLYEITLEAADSPDYCRLRTEASIISADLAGFLSPLWQAQCSAVRPTIQPHVNFRNLNETKTSNQLGLERFRRRRSIHRLFRLEIPRDRLPLSTDQAPKWRLVRKT